MKQPKLNHRDMKAWGCKYVRSCQEVCVCVCVCACVCVYVSVGVLCVCVHVHTYMCVQPILHTYRTYVCTYVHIRTYIWKTHAAIEYYAARKEGQE